MHTSRNMLKMDLLRLIKSRDFWGGIGLIVFFLWFGIWDDFKISSSDVVYYYSLSHLTIFRQFSLAVSAALCATYFCDEWNTKAFWYYDIRIGLKKYSSVRCLSTMISGGMAAVFGDIFFIGSLGIQRTWFDADKSGTRLVMGALRDFIRPQDYIQYFVFSILVLFMRNALFALAAFYLSTLIPNRFVTVVSPVILWFALSFVSSKLRIPNCFDLTAIYSGRCNMGSPYIWFIYVFSITGMLCLIFMKLCGRSLCKRIEK